MCPVRDAVRVSALISAIEGLSPLAAVGWLTLGNARGTLTVWDRIFGTLDLNAARAPRA